MRTFAAMEIPNKEYLMAWLPGVSTPWMLRPRALCEGREANCSHHGGHKSCIGGIAAHPCKERKDGAPSVTVGRRTSFKGWASRPCLRTVPGPSGAARTPDVMTP